MVEQGEWKGGRGPEDLRPLGLVNIFKSGLIKGI